MALTSNVKTVITILDNGVFNLRYEREIYEDGVYLASKLHRETLVPGQDVSNYPMRLRALTNVVWTPAVIAAYQASITPLP